MKLFPFATRFSSPAADYFRTDDLHADLGKRTARGGLYTVVTMALNFFVVATSTFWLTYQLSPEDFGLYTMILVIINFSTQFVDLGLSRAVVQNAEINHEQVSTLFWINLAIASVITLLIAMATPLICAYYRNTDLAPINLSMSLIFLMSGFVLQHRALLQRRMEFGRISLVGVISPAVGAVAGITLAYLGGGYWALVAVALVTQLANCIGFWIACSWRPGPPRRGTGVRKMIAFGGHVTAYQLINYFTRNVDQLLLGRWWGAVALGLYGRALMFMTLPATKIMLPLTQVLVPSLSRLTASPEKYRKFFQSALGLLATACILPSVLLLLMAPEIFPLLFPPKWDDMVPIFLALGPAAIVISTASASWWLYLSFGHVERQTYAGLANMVLTVIAILCALPYGVLAVALAVSFARVVSNLPYVAYSCKGTPITLKDYVKAVSWPIWISTISAAGAMAISTMYLKFVILGEQPLPTLWKVLPITTEQKFVILVIKIVAWTGLMIAMIALIPPARAAIYAEPKSLLMKLLKRKEVAAETSEDTEMAKACESSIE
jgi:O-antigen/teichoic acid export membrane protein